MGKAVKEWTFGEKLWTVVCVSGDLGASSAYTATGSTICTPLQVLFLVHALMCTTFTMRILGALDVPAAKVLKVL